MFNLVSSKFYLQWWCDHCGTKSSSKRKTCTKAVSTSDQGYIPTNYSSSSHPTSEDACCLRTSTQCYDKSSQSLEEGSTLWCWNWEWNYYCDGEFLLSGNASNMSTAMGIAYTWCSVLVVWVSSINLGHSWLFIIRSW